MPVVSFHSRGLLPESLARGLMPVYRAGLGLKYHLTRARRLPVPVISVGNLTVGGTGKTPAVIHLANELAKTGQRAAILSRGYGRTSRRDFLMAPFSVAQSTLTHHEAGDEPLLIARSCPEAVVAVGSRRDRLGRRVIAEFAPDVILLDDGFQHWRLARDLNLVLINSRFSIFAERLLPLGRLREDPSALRRADAFILTNVADVDLALATRRALRERFSDREQPVLFSRPSLGPVRDVVTGEECSIAGRRVAAVSGLASPRNFERMLREAGAAEILPLRFGDHHVYSPADITRIKEAGRGADLIVTTEKDAVKLTEYTVPNLAVVPLTIRYLPEGDYDSPLRLPRARELLSL